MSIWRKLNLKNKFLLIMSTSLFVTAFIAISGFIYFNNLELESGIINKERTIERQLKASSSFVALQGGLSSVIEKMQNKYKSPDQLTDHDKKEILNQVPIYAALVLGKQNSERDQYNFRVFSDKPRNKNNLANSKELEIFKKFESNPQLEEFVLKEDDVITLFTPVRLSKDQGCLLCHGVPESSPWKNGKDILGHQMENFVDGQVRGVFAISQKKSEVIKASTQGHWLSPDMVLVLAIVLASIFSLIVGFILTQSPMNKLNEVTQVLNNSSHEVHNASLTISDLASDLSQSSTEQAASIQETSASLEQISSMIAKAADGAKESLQAATDSNTKAIEGKQAVSLMLNSIHEIAQQQSEFQNQIQHTNEQMQDIVRVINDIGEKTKVINDIVFQTKLLSFNASVEAARAGEHGKGFAVVAEEVGSLAQMSGNASKEISAMLQLSNEKVNQIINDSKHRFEIVINESKEKIETGVNVANECSQVLEEIVNNVERVTHLSDEISQATSEQSVGVNEINKAMNMLDSVTQQNASNSEKTAQSSETLEKQSASLQDVIHELVLLIDGEKIDQPKVVHQVNTNKKIKKIA